MYLTHFGYSFLHFFPLVYFGTSLKVGAGADRFYHRNNGKLIQENYCRIEVERESERDKRERVRESGRKKGEKDLNMRRQV